MLLDELAESGLDIPDPVQEADQLIVYATQARYPGLIGPVSEQDYRQALVIAEAVVAWAQTIVQ